MGKVMRNLFLMVLVTASCSDNQENVTDFLFGAQNVVGTWKLNGYKISAGGPLPDEFTDTDNIENFIFDLDGTYRLDRFADDSSGHSGVFEIVENELILYPSMGEVEEFRYLLELNRNTLILSPTAPYVCIEGCIFRYQRIN